MMTAEQSPEAMKKVRAKTFVGRFDRVRRYLYEEIAEGRGRVQVKSILDRERYEDWVTRESRVAQEETKSKHPLDFSTRSDRDYLMDLLARAVDEGVREPLPGNEEWIDLESVATLMESNWAMSVLEIVEERR